MDPVFIIVAAVIIVGIIVIAGNFKKPKNDYQPVIQARLPDPITPAPAVPEITHSVTAPSIPEVTQTVTAPTPAPVVPDPSANTVNDPWVSHPAPHTDYLANTTADPWVSHPNTGNTAGVITAVPPVETITPTVVLKDIPSGGYGNWQTFRIINPDEPWKQAFNILADKDIYKALAWGLDNQNSVGNALKGEIDKWFFGSAFNPVTNNSWPTSLGNKLVDLYASDQGANTARILGLPDGWKNPYGPGDIYPLLQKRPKTWTVTQEQYDAAPGIPIEEWNTTQMLDKFR